MTKIENFYTYVDSYKNSFDGNYYYKPDSTRVRLLLGKKLRVEEFPKKSFVKVYKKFYESGELQIEETWLGRVKVGIWRAYDKQGHQTEEVDEDAKFGKIKPADLLRILEKERQINLQTGEGRFDQFLCDNIDYDYTPSKKDSTFFKTEFIPSVWTVTITRMSSYRARALDLTKYTINGETGEIIKKTTKLIPMIM